MKNGNERHWRNEEEIQGDFACREYKRTLKPTQSSLYKLICVTCQDNKGKGGNFFFLFLNDDESESQTQWEIMEK